MRTFFSIAILLLLLASCEIEPALEIDESGIVSLDTAKVDTYNYNEVNVSCQQVLIIEARLDAGNGFALSLVLTYLLDSLNGYVTWIDSSYHWSPSGDTTRSITVTDFSDSMIYKVEITYTVKIEYLDADSVRKDSIIFIPLTDEIAVKRNHLPLYVIPHAFTPNGDGFNDEFRVSAICFSGSRLQIFDSFSNTLLFESTDISFGWDGTYKGKEMPVEEYRYQFEITSVTGIAYHAEGYLQLIR